MEQKTETLQEGTETPGIQVGANLSDRNRRQQEESDPQSVCGTQATGSDLVSFEGVLPESDGEILSNRSTEEQASIRLERFESMHRNQTSASSPSTSEMLLSSSVSLCATLIGPSVYHHPTKSVNRGVTVG
jgi:hypothetical protein